MMDFIELFNAVATVASPAYASRDGSLSLEDRFDDLEIDSLDGMVLLMYLCELYGIDEAASKEWHPVTVGEAHELLMSNKTREPASVADALAEIR